MAKKAVSYLKVDGDTIVVLHSVFCPSGVHRLERMVRQIIASNDTITKKYH